MTAKPTINKAACRRLAGEVRAELGLESMDALDPWDLAELYGVPVVSLSALPLDHDIREHFQTVRPLVFSGALLPHLTGAVIIENDAHPLARRRSTMSHEMAHVVREHRFGASLVNEKGCANADRFQEDEAAEISGELLIPFDAAKQLARRQATDDEVALRFRVSLELARWRMNATGARKIAARSAAVHQRASGT